ncbi:DUF1553 domain-containing protein [Planctomycetes bacterium K23_9]|uniref:Bacterial Ig-like domain (Group 2) n=1 Tax=Stieleria marina TaxID=1930275 RepID=A0A517P0Q1_9BACT|nr:hypothetical protein K239x_49590 [Planctomycetes bacterium K23_9]
MKYEVVVAVLLAMSLPNLLGTSFSSANDGTSVQRVDFVNNIIPLLTKNGCNAGACHGAAIGRGEFKLSLYGSNPKADHIAMVRQLHGRRVNLAQPRESLVVRKPTEQTEHGGGQVFDLDSESAKRLTDWIVQGAPYQSVNRLTRVQIFPQKYIANAIGESIDLRAVAHFSAGSQLDVTKWTVFAAEDPLAVVVDVKTARATIQRPGRHVIVARYLSKVIPIEIIVPLTDVDVQSIAGTSNHFIDHEINATLQVLRLPPSRIADDDAFRRRVTLDLTGRLPATQGVGAKLNRDELIDQLLQSDQFTQYWTYWLVKLLRVRPQLNDRVNARTYYRWLANKVAGDASYKQIATELITATGDSHQNGPANFYRTVGGPREQAEFFSELFLGSRLRCANCHNHPLDRWTQDDYHGLAAIFAKVEPGKIVRDKPAGEVIHPLTGLPAVQRIPGEHDLATNVVDGRDALAKWATDSQNPFFAKAVVNRLWSHMMGRGLVEPVDDFRDTNPATHPALLDQLANDFVSHQYSLRHTLSVIARSDAYARSSNTNEWNMADEQFYSHAIRRPMEPEVLADVISDTLGVPDQYGDQAKGTRAISLIDPKTPSRSLDVLGRCGREMSCETISTTGALPQKLHLFNGDFLNARIAAPNGRLRRWIDAGKTPWQIVDGFYQVALGRRPTAKEEMHWNSLLSQLTTTKERSAFLEDFVWGILVCEEFATNH